MDNETARQIGNLVVVTVAKEMRDKTENNYDLSDYVEDFEGTQEELNISLIKMAAKLL